MLLSLAEPGPKSPSGFLETFNQTGDISQQQQRPALAAPALPPGMSLSVPIFPFTFPGTYVSSTVTFSILPVNSLSPSA